MEIPMHGPWVRWYRDTTEYMSEAVGMVQNTYIEILPIRLAFTHLMPAI